MKALWFSGGKDSMACLLLHEAELSDIHVIWANTGRYFPEALDFIDWARGMCPNWYEVRSDREAQWAANGLPSDIVPIDHTTLGQLITRPKAVKVQSYLGCCFENITAPLVAKTRELGCKTVIRGQRREEAHRAPEDAGEFVFEQPIKDWSAEDVLAYLRERIQLPEHFALEHSSLDCFDCTAFAGQSADRAIYMRNRHPARYAEYRMRLGELTSTFRDSLQAYQVIEHG